MISIAPDMLDLSAYDYIVGIDEAGRGCWAGPVSVGGFVYKKEDVIVPNVNDSKLLTATNRSNAFEKLKLLEHVVLLGSVDQIDSMGIGKIIEELIRNIITQYAHLNAFFIIDGQFSTGFGLNTLKMNKADSLFYPVAAASVLAKVERDNYMFELDKEFPQFQFGTEHNYIVL
jgi:ribonuclease HII